MLKVEYLIPFIVKHKLTSAQFYLLYCLYHNYKDISQLYRKNYPSDNGSMIGSRATDDLIERGYIIVNKRTKTDFEGNRSVVDHYTVSSKFLEFYLDERIAFNELLRCYPNVYIIGNERVFTKSIDVDSYTKKYYSKIENNTYEHSDVVKDILFAKQHSLIDCTLQSFIDSSRWLAWRSVRNTEQENDLFELANDLVKPQPNP